MLRKAPIIICFPVDTQEKIARMALEISESEIADVDAYMHAMGERARGASRVLARATTAQKNRALLAMASALDEARDALETANRRDLEAGRDNGLDEALLDRLALTPARIDTMIEGLRQVAALSDPVARFVTCATSPRGSRWARCASRWAW